MDIKNDNLSRADKLREDLLRCIEVLKHKLSFESIEKLSIKDVHKYTKIEQQNINLGDKLFDEGKRDPYNRELVIQRQISSQSSDALLYSFIGSQNKKENNKTPSSTNTIQDVLKDSGNIKLKR